ncbi:hypothetical protein BN946_scf184970.g10 [Trametes cinnabarina]|uniref:Uncharacterized protein n=1 Tax=Pycnoporus cinnabarinus TaxID=5643 RepID=A0A060SI95_PYCCI|nr:hypothetical protein BN946_scf184970.g10 [Trametes cinnabarina]
MKKYASTVLCPQFPLVKGETSFVEEVLELWKDPDWTEEIQSNISEDAAAESVSISAGMHDSISAGSGSTPSAEVLQQMLHAKSRIKEIAERKKMRIPDATLVAIQVAEKDGNPLHRGGRLLLCFPILLVENKGLPSNRTVKTMRATVADVLNRQVQGQARFAYESNPDLKAPLPALVVVGEEWHCKVFEREDVLKLNTTRPATRQSRRAARDVPSQREERGGTTTVPKVDDADNNATELDLILKLHGKFHDANDNPVTLPLTMHHMETIEAFGLLHKLLLILHRGVLEAPQGFPTDTDTRPYRQTEYMAAEDPNLGFHMGMFYPAN